MRGDARSGEATGARPGRWAIAAGVLLSACWYPKERGQTLEQRVDRIEAEGPAPQAGADHAAVQEQARRIEAQLADLRKRLDELSAAQLRAGDRPAPGDKLADEVTRLRGELDAQTHRLDAVERSLAQARAAAPAQRSSARAARRSPSALAPAASPASTLPEDKTLAFAREQELKGEKGVARDIYQEFVTQFPTDPASAEAHFRLGELAYGERQYRDAIIEYGKVARDFPSSTSAPEALVRTAESMLQVGMRDEARTLLLEVPKRYPGTAAATRAKQRLSELDGTSR